MSESMAAKLAEAVVGLEVVSPAKEEDAAVAAASEAVPSDLEAGTITSPPSTSAFPAPWAALSAYAATAATEVPAGSGPPAMALPSPSLASTFPPIL